MERRSEKFEPELWPRWLRRSRAAFYLSVSERKFDALRKDGLIPPPSAVLGVALYDRAALDDIMVGGQPAAANDNNPWDLGPDDRATSPLRSKAR